VSHGSIPIWSRPPKRCSSNRPPGGSSPNPVSSPGSLPQEAVRRSTRERVLPLQLARAGRWPTSWTWHRSPGQRIVLHLDRIVADFMALCLASARSETSPACTRSKAVFAELEKGHPIGSRPSSQLSDVRIRVHWASADSPCSSIRTARASWVCAVEAGLATSRTVSCDAPPEGLRLHADHYVD
jgi:hypothetical protein